MSGQWKQRLSDGARDGLLSGQLRGHRRGRGRAYITRAVEDRGIRAAESTPQPGEERQRQTGFLCGWGMGGGS